MIRILITLALYLGLKIFDPSGWITVLPEFTVRLFCYLIPYLIIGWDVIFRAVRNIANGQIFDENFLMCIATFAAIGLGDYSEAVAVMLFYQIGEMFQDYAVNRSRQSVSELMDICPEYANVEQNGQLVQVDPDDVHIGDTIVIRAGERIPLDGVVLSGTSMIDTSSLTGESVPRRVTEGEDVISGCINQEGVLYVRVSKEFDDSTVAKILELVENAGSKKAKTENFITKFARYYTPLVVIGAALLAVIPPLLFGGVWAEWIRRASIFLVISCPCALVISVPLGFFGGIGAASKAGVLVKGSNYLEALSEMKTIVFDKTGTLTKGEFKISGIYPAGIAETDFLELAALAEGYSDHPIAKSIRDAYGHELNMERIKDAKEVSGHGVCVTVDGRKILAGNQKLMEEFGVVYQAATYPGTIVYVAEEQRFLGAIVIADEIKEGAAEAIADLKSSGIRRTVMLTGDKAEVAEAVAKQLRLDQVHAELLPGDKVAEVEKLLAGMKGNGRLAFVGDGINDAPVLTRADIGIAMGSLGSDAAIEAADIVLMDDDIAKIARVVKVARKTLRIVRQNIIFALGVKLLVLLLGTFGLATMWEAVFADVGVSVIAILNAMRVLLTSKKDG